MDKTHLLLRLVQLFSQKSLSSTPCKNTNTCPCFLVFLVWVTLLLQSEFWYMDIMSVSVPAASPPLASRAERETDQLLSGV